MENIKDKKNCTGCYACKSICPKKCIELKQDDQGFYYPKVNEENCIHCNLCNKVCPIKNHPSVSEKTKFYAAQNKNEEVRKLSTSGGVFFELAKHMIDTGNYVCGAGFDDKGIVIHKIINNLNDLSDLQGSKYVQSNLNGIFEHIRQILKEGNKILFVGTPCQVAALHNFIDNELRKNLLLVDLVCYGVPSPKVYERWKEEIEKKYKKKVNRIFFRDKSFGFAAPNVKVSFKDGSTKEQTMLIKSYMKLFMNNLSIRPSCTNCQFKGINRTSDITLGDCWSIGKFEEKMDDNKGTTTVLIHTSKGMKAINDINTDIKIIEIDRGKSIKYDGKKLLNSAKYNDNQENYFNAMNKLGYRYAQNKYAKDTLKEKIVTFLKRTILKNKFFQGILKKFRDNR